MSGKLLSLNDSLARSICSSLDIDGLSQLAGANKKFHALSAKVDSDAGKIQALVQRYRLRDLGLRVAYPEVEEDRRAALIEAGPQRWLFNHALAKEEELTLSQNGRFTSHSLQLKELYVNGSSRYLFSKKGNRLQVRDPRGNLLTSIPVSSFTHAFELPFRQNQQLILLVMEDKLEVWDIAQKENNAPILVHPVPAAMGSPEQFDNTLVLERYQKGISGSALFVYDMNDFEKPPQEVVHSRHPRFSSAFRRRNASQLFLCGLNRKDLITYIPKNGNFSWEISDRDRYYPECANEKWLVLFFSTASYEEIHAASIKVVDAKTGASCGEFCVPYVGAIDFSYDFTLWGSSILVAKKEDTLLFWLLPEGRKLPSWKLENCKIQQIHVSGKQLLVHYEDRNSSQYRVISLNTPPSPEEAAAPNDLPHLSLIQPERKELSLCERIYSCVSLIFDWLASIWHWFWH